MANLDRLATVVRTTDAAPQHWNQGWWLVEVTAELDRANLPVVDEDGSGASLFTPGPVPLTCGTAGCLAGNTALIAGAQPVWKPIADGAFAFDSAITNHVSKQAEYVIPPGATEEHPVGVQEFAVAWLDLTVAEQVDLFFYSNTRQDIQKVCVAIAASQGQVWPVPLPAWAQ